ncbi:MAG: type I pullulanase [Oscillospiraceae bacterium]|nr:type I pullulanase [Oscillospiraceae bacterium]
MLFAHIDEKYAFDGELGAIYSREKTEFRLWAPEAEEVKLHIYGDCRQENPVKKVPMTKGDNGVWSFAASGDLDGLYYTYAVTYDGIENETVDPYARSVGVNGAMGMILNTESCNPTGWENQDYVKLDKYTDACVYELHVRDFSIDPSGGFCYKGRFLGFIEKGLINAAGDSVGIDHIKDLGVTHVQLMPIFDYERVDETNLRKPQFNWGYDPRNFNSPNGSYSTNPFDGRTRVIELKRLIHALHSKGIGVIMDVVYNHTFATADSCFNKIYPKYYYRLWGENGEHFSNGSGCGNEVATERAMVRKFIVDSICYWAKEYKIDGFRFDLMGLYDIDTLNIISARLKEINPNVILYGEGWAGGDSPVDWNLRGMKLKARHTPDFGYFSDDFRDTVKGNNFENRIAGYVNGATGNEENVREIMCGRISHPQLPQMDKYAWTDTPAQTVNYVEAHDNLTLWDKLHYTNSTDSTEKRKSMDKMAAAMVFLAQGIPFIQAGQEFLRSKPLPGGNTFDHNSYNSPDIINSLKWDRKSLHRDVYEYYRGLIAFRKAHSAFRMTDKQEIGEKMRFLDNLPNRVVGFLLYGDNEFEEIVVFLNPNDYPVDLHAFGSYQVYIDGFKAGTEPLRTVEGDYKADPMSVIVLGRKRQEEPAAEETADGTETAEQSESA